ncbi:MAG: hypothetical protein J6Y63_02060 [Bacteroidales bacterium]|nr:hypothetical protein [Bacteroidales bacterium]
MKRILLLMLLLLPALWARAGEPFTPTKAGTTLVFERTKANGRVEYTSTMQYTGVRREGGKLIVEYTFTIHGPGGNELYGGAAPMSTTVTADGTTEQDLGASLKAVLHNMFPGAAQEVETVPARLPANLKPGDRLPDAHARVKTGVLTHTMDITEREVLRTERITVPAGTFDCVVLREHKIEHGVGRERDNICENWYAPGIGPVRHDSYRLVNGVLKLNAREVLKKY